MILSNAFDVLPIDGGTSRVSVCIFSAVHVDLTADLRAGNPSLHPTALEAHSVRECDGQCQAGLPSIRLIVDFSGQAERDVRDAMRSLLASQGPRVCRALWRALNPAATSGGRDLRPQVHGVDDRQVPNLRRGSPGRVSSVGTRNFTCFPQIGS